MRIFAVSREGVYRHEIVGVYDDIELAIERGVNAAKEEWDDYHHFDVLEYTLNEDVMDGKLLAKISKHKDSITVHRIKYEDEGT
jgi:hypothetical protein